MTDLQMPAREPASIAEIGAKGFLIVRASSSHADAAVRLVEEYQDAVNVVVRDTPEDISASLGLGSAGNGKAIWLAYANDRAVGCVAFRELKHLPLAGEVKRLYVQPAYRGRGIAEALVAAVEHFAAEQGLTSLYLDSKDDLVAAIRFYQRRGYLPCERYNENPQATVFMCKQIIPPVVVCSPSVATRPPVVIQPFEAKDAEAFRLLNEAWISTLFQMEEKDREVLNDPIGRIITPGGQIFMAVRGDICIGCCALIAMGNGSFELAKMAVAEKERGRGVGRLVLEWVVAEMRAQRVARLYLETNSSLQNAIHLYRAVGFRQLEAHEITPSPYARSDVSMELLLG